MMRPRQSNAVASERNGARETSTQSAQHTAPRPGQQAPFDYEAAAERYAIQNESREPQMMKVTTFADRSATSKRDSTISWDAQIARLALAGEREYPSKEACPLLKLAHFGDHRTDNNCLRHDANVIAICGIEGDYDREELSIADAATLLADAGLEALIYTSPSHTPEKPRWRVLCPTSHELPPSERKRLVARLNGVLGGILATESFALSQSYYYGRVKGAEYQQQQVRGGRCIDQCDDLREVYATSGNGAAGNGGASGTSATTDDEHRETIRTGSDGVHAATVGLAARLAGRGMAPDDIMATLYAMFDDCEWRESAQRWQARRAEIPDAVASAVAKFRDKRSEMLTSEASRAHADEADPDPWPEAMNCGVLHGIAGEFVRMIQPDTEADQAAILAQFLVTFGALVGRGPHYKVEGDQHHSNLFVLLIGETAKARKGTAFGRVREVFERIPDWNRTASGLSSGEGLKYHVRDAREENKTGKDGAGTFTEVIDEGMHDKRLLVVEPEFGGALRSVERAGNTLSATIREAWDSGTMRTLTKHDAITATGAHVCIIGHITVDELRAELTATDRANGFANRFLFVAVKRSKFLPHGGQDAD